MTDSEKQEWSRHYDTIHWGIIGIVAAALSALLIRSLDADRTPAFTNIAGVSLSLAGVYYIACFRRWQRLLHSEIEDLEFQRMNTLIRTKNPIRTWSVLVLIFWVMDLIFLGRLFCSGQAGCIGILIAPIIILTTCLLILLWDFGNG